MTIEQAQKIIRSKRFGKSLKNHDNGVWNAAGWDVIYCISETPENEAGLIQAVERWQSLQQRVEP